MVQPWFNPNEYAWIPGVFYGTVAALMSGLVSWLAAHGRARSAVLGAWFALWFAGVMLLLVGFFALYQGQPWGIWYGFLLTGAIGTVVVGANYYVLKNVYRRLEEHKMALRDML